MSEHPVEPAELNGAVPRRPRSRGSLIERLRLAASFLTILPVSPASELSEQASARSYALFPLIGAILGAGIAGEAFVLSHVFDAQLSSILIVASLTVVTGAIHLDGLADTADALGAGVDRSRALAILRDSRIGSFGAIALILVLGTKFAVIAALIRSHRYAAIAIAPVLARWAMVAVSFRMTYLRESGAGSFLQADEATSNLRIATAISVVCLVTGWRWISLRSLLIATVLLIGTVMALRRFYRRWLGGFTGDLLGAAGELAEVLVLISLAS